MFQSKREPHPDSITAIMRRGQRANDAMNEALRPSAEAQDRNAMILGAGLAAGAGYGLYRFFGGGKSKGKGAKRSSLGNKK